MVQDIVHQLQQVPATAYHGFGAAALFPVVQVRVQQGFAVTDDRRQRRPDFMAHVGQELALGLGGVAGQLFLQPFLFPFTLDLQALVAFGGIDAGAFQVHRHALGIVGGVQGDGRPALLALTGKIPGFDAFNRAPCFQLLHHQPPQALIGYAGFQHVRIFIQQFTAAVVTQKLCHGRVGGHKFPLR